MKKIVKFAGKKYEAISALTYEDFLLVMTGRIIRPRYIDFLGFANDNELLFRASFNRIFGIVYSNGFQKGSEAKTVYFYEEVGE